MSHFCAGRDGTGTQIEKVNGTGRDMSRPFYIPDLNRDYLTSKQECHDYDFYDADDVLFTYGECLNLIQYSKNH